MCDCSDSITNGAAPTTVGPNLTLSNLYAGNVFTNFISVSNILIPDSPAIPGYVLETTGTSIAWVPQTGGGGGSQWTGTIGNPIYYTKPVGIGSAATPSATLMVTGNIYASNALSTPNVFATTANIVTLNVSSVSIPSSQPTPGYVMVTNGTTVSWAPPLNLIFSGTFPTKTLTGYVDVSTGLLYAVTAASTASGSLVLTIASFNPAFTYTINTLSPSAGYVTLPYWDTPVTQFAVTATNTSLQLQYISQISSISAASPGIVDSTLGNYTFSSNDPNATQAKPNVHSYILSWTDTLTETGSIQSGQTGVSGGSASFSVSFTSYQNGTYVPWGTSLPISVQWPSISALNQFSPSLPTTLDFLRNYQSAAYTVTYSGISNSPVIDTQIGNGGSTGTSIQTPSAQSSTLLIASPYLYKDSSSVTLNLFSNIVFTRPSTVSGGGGYTQNISYTTLQTNFKPSTTYGFFWTQNVARHVITSSPEVVTGTSWAANNSVLKNAQASLPFTLSASGTSSNPELYIGFTRAAGSYSNVTFSGGTPDYAGTIALRPAGSDVPGAYSSVTYAYYRFYLASDQSITINSSTVAPFDGNPNITITPQYLPTFLSNISTTPFTSGYNGSFPARLSLALDASTTSGTTFSNTIVGTNSNGTIIFPNRTLHKNSNYTIKINVGGQFYTADTPQTQTISTSCTFPAQTVTYWPTFWTQKAANPSILSSSDILSGAWPSTTMANPTNGGIPGSFTFTNGTSPEFFFGYSANNSTFSASTTFVALKINGGADVTPAPYIPNDQSTTDGTVNLLPTSAPGDYLSEKFKYFRYYINPSNYTNPQLTLSTYTGAFDGSSSATFTVPTLSTWLSNVSSTTYSVGYNGHYGGTLSMTRTFNLGSGLGQGVESNAGPLVSGTYTFPNKTFHKNSIYNLVIGLTTTFIRPGLDTSTSTATGGSLTFSATPVLYPSFYNAYSTATVPTTPATGNWAGAFNSGTWLGSPSLYHQTTSDTIPTPIVSGTSSGNQAFIFGYSRKSSIGYSNLTVSINSVPQTPDLSGTVTLAPSGAPSDYASETYVYYRYYLPTTNPSLALGKSSGPTDLANSPVPTLAVSPVSLYNFLRWNTFTNFTVTYSGQFSAVISGLGSYGTPSVNGSLSGIGTTGTTTSGTLTWPGPLYNQNSVPLAFSITATYQTPEGATVPKSLSCTAPFSATVSYPTFWTQQSTGTALTSAMVVTGTYAANNGDIVNNYYGGLPSSINPSAGLQEFYFGYSRSCTTFSAATYDPVVRDNNNNIYLTPDYSSNIALQCSDVPSGWKSSNYVYWRYLTNSTNLGLSLTSATATGTPSLTFTPPVAANNFLNWVSSTSGTASYSGLFYGVMTFTNSGKGTLTGTLTGTSNALTLDFGFKLHKSNSFNLSISMNTQFQKPDSLGDLIGSTPTGWTNNPTAILSVTYPTFFVLRDVNYYQILVPDIVSGVWSDNSGNFKTVSYNGSTTGDNPWYVIHDDGIYNYGISNGGPDAIVIPARTGSSSRYLWYCYTASNPVYNALPNKSVIFYGYYTGQYNTGATVTYQGQTTLNFPGTALGTLPSDYSQQVYNIGYIQINDSNADTHLQIAWS